MAVQMARSWPFNWKKKDLSVQGHRIWLDKQQIKSGASWEEQIEEAILSHDIFISLLTPHAVRRPKGVCLDEISMARYNSRKIIPANTLQVTNQIAGATAANSKLCRLTPPATSTK